MKELVFKNGQPRDADECRHTVINRPGQATPVCWTCGQVNPNDDEREDGEGGEA